MEIFKNEIKLSDREKLEEFIGGFPHETSGMSFSSIYMWSREYTYRYEIIDDFLTPYVRYVAADRLKRAISEMALNRAHDISEI